MKISWDKFSKRYGPVVVAPPGRYTLGRELSTLLTLAVYRQPAKILEMFTAYGHTACALAAACPESQVHAFDVCREKGGYDAESPFSGEVMSESDVGAAIRNAPDEVRARVNLVIEDGALLRKYIHNLAPYHFIYIDGDHTWRRVRGDTALALEVATDDATLVWDDYWKHCPDVVRFIDSVNREAGDFVTQVNDTRMCYTTLTKEIRQRLGEIVVALEDVPRP